MRLGGGTWQDQKTDGRVKLFSTIPAVGIDRKLGQITAIAYTATIVDTKKIRPMLDITVFGELTLLGWIHTIIAIIALIAGFYTLAVYKVITPEQKTGQLYLICTLIAAVTALMIYKHGGFGPAHGLAVLTLLALVGG
ncbi:MAG: hypothetical protein ACI88G_001897, partial [Woeseiaceae bacterium]